MKGALSYGKITADFDKSLFFGKALIDAYSLEEQLFIYGMALDEKIEKKLRQYDNLVSYCVRTKVATKSGSITHHIINWMNFINILEEGRLPDKEESIKIMETFYHDMSGHPRKYLDNTIDYINAST